MKVTIRFVNNEFHTKREETCTISGQVSLGYALREKGIEIPYDCGGNGICGKCRVRFLTGAPEPTSRDRALFSEKQLQQGYRLACEAKLTRDCEIEIAESAGDIQGIALENVTTPFVAPEEYGVAVDLGTTTIALALISLEKKTVLKTTALGNSQRKYGADVMSRMQQSIAGEKEKLKQLVIEDIKRGIETLCLGYFGQTHSEKEWKPWIKRVVIAGNTTMCHLLLGYSCESLAVAPFKPVSVQKETITFQGIETIVLPGISAFIGGDIVAGLSELCFHKDDNPKLLLDLGTNGEMVLWANHRYYAVSASAGPALEGGNISCGCPSVNGAIYDVMIAGTRRQIKTIGNAPAIGICGSGLISLMSGMLRNRVIDEQGIFREEFSGEYTVCDGTQAGEKKVCITQEDVQNFQLAKSAIYCGIKRLLCQVSEKSDLENLEVYLAGGLGVHLPIQAAINVGLFPKDFMGHIKTVGNSSLQGAIAYLCQPEIKNECIQKICTHTDVLSLNEWPEFEQAYVENLLLKKR